MLVNLVNSTPFNQIANFLVQIEMEVQVSLSIIYKRLHHTNDSTEKSHTSVMLGVYI